MASNNNAALDRRRPLYGFSHNVYSGAPLLMSGHFSISSDLKMKRIGCKKNKSGKKGKSLALLATFVLFAAPGLHQRTDSFVKVS
jgi:hypothetical protein